MNVPLDPIRQVPCTIPGCYKSFDTGRQMRYHKHEGPDHFFCKRCNVDIVPQTWDAFVEHKVEAMAPWVECRRDRRPEGPPQHIVCEFCGEDFKCFGGRLRHREMRHQAEQTIPCPGCKEVFPRAGDMIAHIENGECNVITEWDFYAHVQHKFVRNEIMKDLGEISENLQINPAFAVPKINPGLIEDDDTLESIENKTDGGVLLDDENEGKKGGDDPLEAQLASLKLDGKKVPLTRSNVEVWPRLPNQPKSGLAGQALTRTIGSPPPSIIDSDIPASQFASQITSRRGGIKIHTESYPSLQSSRVVSESSQGGFDDGDGVSSAGTAKAESVLMRPAAWTTEQTPRALFGDVKPEPQSAVTKSILKKRDEEQSKAPNLLINARWWDPMSEDYTAHLFLDTVKHLYRCPFPVCDGAEFEHVKHIEEHLLCVHAKVQFRCPGCFKLFRKAQGMMSHMESTMKCPVKKSKYFKSAVDDITGGIMRAKHLPQPAVYRTSTAVVRSDQVTNGVMSTRYKASLPNVAEGAMAGLGSIW